MVGSERDLSQILNKLYLECEHGDHEHREWLRHKFDDFNKRNNRLIRRVEIFDFTEYVKLSNARRAKPYIQGKCRVPKKYNLDDHHWIKKGRDYVLARKSDGIVLVANPLAAGTPKLRKVNGQDIYNGNVSRQARASLVKAVHNYVATYINALEPITDIELFPLTVEILFYVHDRGKNNIDNDNKWVWRKCIQDTLTECGIIVDDNPQFICRNEEETILIPDDEEQKLIINIYGSNNKNN